MSLTLEDRLFGRTVRTESGCLRFTGCHNSKGYGVVSVNGERKLAHRVAYEQQVGPIPDGLTIDHVAARGCRYKDCIEPAHLEPVTNAENQARAPKSNKTHCDHGHEYTPENTIVKKRRTGRTIRNCRACHNDRRRAAYITAAMLAQDVPAAIALAEQAS